MAETTSFHKSVFGKFGEDLPCDLDGYVHLTAEAWLAANMGIPEEERADTQLMFALASKAARVAQEAVAKAEADMAKWRAGQ